MITLELLQEFVYSEYKFRGVIDYKLYNASVGLMISIMFRHGIVGLSIRLDNYNSWLSKKRREKLELIGII